MSYPARHEGDYPSLQGLKLLDGSYDLDKPRGVRAR